MKRTFQPFLETLEKEMLRYVIDNPSCYMLDAYSITDDKLALSIAIHLIPISREVYKEKLIERSDHNENHNRNAQDYDGR